MSFFIRDLLKETTSAEQWDEKPINLQLRLKFLIENEIDKIKSQYKLSQKQWESCIYKFDKKVIKDLNVKDFEIFIDNWKNNLKPYDNQTEDPTIRKMIRYSDDKLPAVKKLEYLKNEF